MRIKNKIKQFCTAPRLLVLGTLAGLIILSLSHPLYAQAVTRSYASDQPLQRGMLVQLKKDDSSKVEIISQKNMDKFHGVVVDANDAPVTISGDGDKTFVATAGHYDVLVSNQNGPIIAGDYITVSALDGIGMKAGTAEPFIVGRAIGAFDGTTGAISTAKIKDSSGGERSVNIARVQLDIGIGKNPFLKSSESNVPEFLRKASEAVAGKPVNAVRIYTGVVIFIVSTVIAGILLYGAVRSAIISIGRNPLSKKSIIRGMFQVILVSLIIFLTGIFGVYLLLKV